MVIMKHILFDLKGCSADLLDDARHVRNSLFHASLISNSKILKIDYHEFTPQGVTGFALSKRSADHPLRSNRICVMITIQVF